MPYSQKNEDLLKELETDKQNGLATDEVLARQSKYGANKLREKKKKTTLQRFLDQFKEAMILILIAAAIVSFVVVCVEKNWGELFEPALILLMRLVWKRLKKMLWIINRSLRMKVFLPMDSVFVLY